MKNNLKALILSSMAIGLLAGCSNPTDASSQNQPTGTATVTDTATATDTTVAPLPATHSLMKHWAKNGTEEVYEVEDANGKVKVTYTDAKGENAGGWEFFSRSFQYDAPANVRFGEYKKIVFKGKLTKTTGTDVVMIKVQGTDGNQIEAKFNFKAETKTYELGLGSIQDWSKVEGIYFFVNRGTSLSGNGVIEFDEFYLSKEEVVEANKIGNAPEVPQDTNVYNGGDKFAIMGSWGYGNNTMTAKAENGGWTFNYGNEEGKKGTYDYVNALINNGSKEIKTAGFKRIHFKLNGTIGDTVMVKMEHKGEGVEGVGRAIESPALEFVTDTIEYDIDITNWVEKLDGNFMAMIFPKPGNENGKGTIKLADCYMDKTPAVKYINPNANPISGETIELNKLIAEPVYKVTTEGRKHTIKCNYENKGNWANIKALVAGTKEELGAFNHLSGTITSDKKVTIMLKPYDNEGAKLEVTLNANEPYTIDKTFAKGICDEAKPLLMFIGFDDASELGATLVVENLQYDKNAKIDYNNYVENNRILINKFALVDDHFVVTNENNVTTVAIDTTGEGGYPGITANVKETNNRHFRVTGKVKVTEDCQMILKVYGKETSYNLTKNTEQVLDYLVKAPDFNNQTFTIMLRKSDGSALVATATFTELALDSAANVIADNKAEVTNFLMVDPVYTLMNENHVTTVTVNKAELGWQQVRFAVEGEGVETLNKITGTVEADHDITILIKPHDSKEIWITLTANTPYTLNETYELNPDQYKWDWTMFLGARDGTVTTGTVVTFTNFTIGK